MDISFISGQLDIPPSSMKYFTDSKVVLGYIGNRTRRFYTYVSHRVTSIQEFSSPEQWNYVPSERNPADAATRSSLQDIDVALDQWLSGPTYLLQDVCSTNVTEHFPLLQPDDDKEIRPEIFVKKTSVGSSLLPIVHRFDKFSSWKALLSAFVILIHIVKAFRKDYSGICRGWHICDGVRDKGLDKEVELFVISEVQKEHYSMEISALKSGIPLSKDSPILSLSPYLDASGLLRVGGRLRNMRNSLGLASLNPVIIPKGHIAKLLVLHYHELIFHQGRHITEGAIRSNGFWIIGAKKTISFLLHQCVECRKLRGRPTHQKMADLPEDRLSPGPPFTSVGVDVFGPWQIVTRKTCGAVAHRKRWAVLFTCMTTRAVHIEVLEDLSSSCFINSLRRFVAIRGPVKKFRSDRGTNFVGAVDNLKVDVIHVEDPKLQKHLRESEAVWHFNAPHSSHMGGVWERAIGMARRILDGILLKTSYKDLTHEVLSTFLAEVTAVMNSRPITAVDTDSDDPLVLSPNLLLTQKQGDVPRFAEDIGLKDMYTAQWKQVQVLSNMFWKRWRDSYLDQLQNRRKWKLEHPNIKKGDVVLIIDKNTHRSQWPIAVVKDVIVSSDNLVRKAVVRLFKGGKSVLYTRPNLRVDCVVGRLIFITYLSKHPSDLPIVFGFFSNSLNSKLSSLTWSYCCCSYIKV